MFLESTLERYSAELRATAGRTAFALAPRVASAVLAMEARGLGAVSIPHLFARDLKQIPPTLNDDLLELFARSRLALVNRFAFFGEAESFESEINWQPPRSTAWLTEFHAFDYAVDLALTFRISGDERFARHLRYLMASWIAANPPGRAPGWAPLALARRIRNWILAADLAREAFEEDSDFFNVSSSSLAQQVTFLAWNVRRLGDRRARLMASRALLVAGRAFARGEPLSELSRALLAEALAERAASYADHPQPLRQFELAAACAEHVWFGKTAGEVALEALKSALETLEGMLHPDGALSLVGREPLPPPEAVSGLFFLGAAILGVPRWKTLVAGETGILPCMLVGEAGLQRFNELPIEPWCATPRLESNSGIFRIADSRSSAMLITATPPASRLDHSDLFSFELSVNGQRTIVDSGIPYAALTGPQDDLTAALHHNVVLVDGKALQATTVHAVPVETHEGVLGLWLISPGSHARGCFLLDGKVWVVMDRVDGPRGRVESRLHFFPAFELELRDGGVLARSGAASVAVIPMGQEGAVPTLTLPSPGCYAPAPGIRYPSPVLALGQDAASPLRIIGYIISSDITLLENHPTVKWVGDGLRLMMPGKTYSIPGSGGL